MHPCITTLLLLLVIAAKTADSQRQQQQQQSPLPPFYNNYNNYGNQYQTDAMNTPPYFNLARGRKIEASATCGEFRDYLEAQKGHPSCNEGPALLRGAPAPRGELYCKLTGANWARKEEALHTFRDGQFCDCCYPGDPEHGHPAQYAIDGTEKWWQSPPLSRGYQYQQVNLTIDLGQIFHVAWILIKMANTPRPEQWVLERSSDFGATWQPWQYFAGSARDCYESFGVLANSSILTDDTVLCTTDFSKIVPLEGGEILVSLVNDRPSANNFFLSDSLRNWTTATHIRLRLQRIKTLMGQYISRQNDDSVTRRYYYSIKDIHIGGRCMCHGYSNTCFEPRQGSNVFYCDCKNNTAGQYCERCAEGFFQKRWRPARSEEPFECEACNCNGHSRECVYDKLVDEQRKSMDVNGNFEGGGVCVNCRSFTTGINCESCQDRFYRAAGVAPNATTPCIPCPCDLRYTTGKCAMITGQCECRREYTGNMCDRCSLGYYGYPDCIPCPCSINGTLDGACLPSTRQCVCRPQFAGAKCDECAAGFYMLNGSSCVACECDTTGSSSPSTCNRLTGQCTCFGGYAGRRCNEASDGYFQSAWMTTAAPCECDTLGTTQDVCDKKTGACLCRLGYAGSRCDVCANGYAGYPNCTECDCEPLGTLPDTACDAQTGQCQCKSNFGGRGCRQCKTEYYNYPQCTFCDCSNFGAIGKTCNNDGSCTCRPGYEGKKCDRCQVGRYNYPRCEECNCHPAGVVASSDSCTTEQEAKGELCECKPRVTGRTCDRCKALFFGLTSYNALGCLECGCYTPGTISALRTCAGDTGQCPCKPYVGPSDRVRYTSLATSTAPTSSMTNGGRSVQPVYKQLMPMMQSGAGVTGVSGGGVGDGMRRCSLCKDRFYGLADDNLLGCKPCQCDAGGAYTGNCDKNSGKCKCRARVTGTRCEQPMPAHYAPSLHQHKFEAEEGRTSEYHRTRFGFDDAAFPNYSWRGFANLSSLQPDVLVDTDVPKPGLYQILIRYVNPTSAAIPVRVQFEPQQQQLDPRLLQQQKNNGRRIGGGNGNSEYSSGQLLLVPTPGNVPQYAVVEHSTLPNTSQTFIAEARGAHVVTLRLQPTAAPTAAAATTAVTDAQRPVRDPNDIFSAPEDEIEQDDTLKFSGSELLYVDYVVLLPDAYYDARILRRDVYDVCLEKSYMDQNKLQQQIPCRKLAYPPMDKVQGISRTGSDGESQRALNSAAENEVEFELNLASSEPQVIVVEYFTNKPQSADTLDVEFRARRADSDGSTAGSLVVYDCPYHILCRSVITDPDGQAQTFTSTSGRAFVRFVSNADDAGAVLTRLTAIPAASFSNDFVTPSTTCLLLNERQLCEQVALPEISAPNVVVVEAETESNVYEIPLVNNQIVASGGGGGGGTSLRSVGGTLRLHGRVLRPDNYTLVLQYMNPTQVAELVDIVIQTSNIGWGERPTTASAGVVKFEFCPSIAGCRTLVQALDNGGQQQYGGAMWSYWNIQDEFTVTIEDSSSNNLDIWIDKLYAVPSDKWRNLYVEELPTSVADSFIENCRATFFDTNNTNSNSNATNQQLCRDATFSLTTEYNNGALPCGCNIDGIENARFDCKPLGGQCACKPNIIGRTCSRCRTGYFGFPQCRKCDCPYNALCDENNGQCLCPPGVTGQKCDRCRENSYGFDPYIGCQPCECNEQGIDFHSSNNNFQQEIGRSCDERNGQCPCRTNVIGRTCNQCAVGFFSFPQCRGCACGGTLGGTLKGVCNPVTGECLCKPLVQGRECEQCRAGAYNLQLNNMLGCTPCFCFDRSDTCFSSNMFKTPLMLVSPDTNTNNQQNSWQIAPVATSGSLARVGAMTIAYKPDLATPQQPAFFLAPSQQAMQVDENEVGTINSDESDRNSLLLFSGNQLKSYGGRLRYTLTPLASSTAGVATASGQINTHAVVASDLYDVVLVGGGMYGENDTNFTLVHYAAEQPNVGTATEFDIPLTESAFSYSSAPPRGKITDAVSRENFLRTLANVTALRIRATYFTNIEQVQLSNVILDTASAQRPLALTTSRREYVNDTNPAGVGVGANNLVFARAVEQCHCPPAYTGLSCEQCAPGHHYRTDVVGRGQCVACDCNGFSSECDVRTGECLACQYNTHGAHCEECDVGFFGDPKMFRGVPSACQPCQCPFIGSPRATGCHLGRQDVVCECLPGYVGDRCEQCAPMYFSDRSDGTCKVCQCNNNLDANDPFACDADTGACLRCANNTAGAHCEQCAPGHYGSALNGGKCLPCQCEACGTETCHNVTGECGCLPHVQGALCDKCEFAHWGGVSPTTNKLGTVNGDERAGNADTDSNSIFSAAVGAPVMVSAAAAPYCGQGCQACLCAPAAVNKQCSELTGQCECRPGVTGRTCNMCKSGFYNLTDDGCLACQCDSKYSRQGAICNSNTGQCSCLPGVTGIGCDRCKWRHVLIGSVGCRGCPPCVHMLLDTTDQVEKIMEPALIQMNASTSSFFIQRRIGELTRRHALARTGLNKLEYTQTAAVVGQWNADLSSIEEQMQTQLGSAQSMVNHATRLRDRSASDIGKAEQERQSIFDVRQQSQRTYDAVQNLERSLMQSGGIRIDSYVGDAEQSIDRIRKKNFTGYEDDAQKEVLEAQQVQHEVVGFNTSHMAGAAKWQRLQRRFAQLGERVQEARTLARNVSKTTQRAGEVAAVNDARLADSIDYITLLANTMPSLALNATQTAAAAAKLNEQSAYDLEYTQGRTAVLDTELNGLRQRNEAERRGYEQLGNMVMQNDAYVNNATRQFGAVNFKLSPVTETAKSAVAAASAYTTIQTNLQQARKLADDVANTPQIDTNVVERQKEQADVMSNGIRQTWQTTINLGPNVNAESTRLATIQANLTHARKQANDVQQLVQRLQERVAATKRAELSNTAKDYTVEATNAQKLANTASAQIARLAQQFRELSADATVLLPSVANVTKQPVGVGNQAGAATEADDTAVDADVELNGNYKPMTPTEMLTSVEHALELSTRLSTQQQQALDKVEKLRASMGNIRTKIGTARQVAKRIQVGVQLGPNSRLQIKTPENIERTAMFTDLSMSFRSKSPDGLLFYLGNEVGSGRRVRRDYNPVTDDYLTLQLVKGFVRLTYNLGEEDVDVQSDMYVANGQWHYVRVERTAQMAELVVQNSKGQVSRARGAGRGLFSVLDLNRKTSAVFAGGMPDEFGAQRSINSKQFIGCIDNLRLFDEPLGLWNFDGVMQGRTTANPTELRGCANPRPFSITDGSGAAGGGGESDGAVHFSTSSVASSSTFARFDRDSLLTETTTGMMLNFQLRTFQRNALLFWTGGPSSYITAFLKDGRIVLQFDQGSGVAQAVTAKTYNDGEWHSVFIELHLRQGALTVDSGQPEFTEAPGDRDAVFRLGEPYVYIGGVEPNKRADVERIGVPLRSLNGCMRALEINSNRVDLTRPTLSEGMERRCSSLQFFVRQVAFNSTGGYLKLLSSNSSSSQQPQTGARGAAQKSFTATLKFKTRQADGLILTAGNAELSGALSLYLQNGQLFLTAYTTNTGEGGAELKTSSDSNRFHNGEWHYVTIVQDAERLQMNVDDYEHVTARATAKTKLNTNEVVGPFFLAGVPPDSANGDTISQNPELRGLPTFIGCIGDLTINKQPRNLFSEQFSENAVFGGGECAVQAVGEQWYMNLQRGGGTGDGDDSKNFVVVNVPPVFPDRLPSALSTTTTSTVKPPPARSNVDVIIRVPTLSPNTPSTTRTPTTTTTTTRAPPPPANNLLVNSGPGITLREPTKNLPPAPAPAATTAYPIRAIVDNVPQQQQQTTPAVTTAASCKIFAGEIASPMPNDMYKDKGLLFGKSSESRMEYHEPLSLDSLLKSGTFTFDVNSRAQNGIVLYADGGGGAPGNGGAAAQKSRDFLAVYFQDGYLIYAFNPGSGAGYFKSSQRINDGNWHQVQVNRTGIQGTLYIDGILAASGSSKNTLHDVNLKHPFYVGGVPSAKLDQVRQNLRLPDSNQPSGLKGFLRQLRLNGQELIAPTFYDVASGDTITAEGVYFPPSTVPSSSAQYIAPLQAFVIGKQRTITLEIRPQALTGLIMAVHSTNGQDAMVVSLVDGHLYVSVENGLGIATVSARPSEKHYFCNGEFHNIRISKDGNVLSLDVDDDPSLQDLGIGTGSAKVADTNSPLYIGGIDPQMAAGLAGVETTAPFVGCIRDVRIDDKRLDFTSVHAVSGRVMGFCPG